MIQDPAKNREAYADILDVDESQVEYHTTLLGFELRSEPMPDNPQETLYSLTHPDLPGMALGDSDPWRLLLLGIEVAGRICCDRMESGEPIPQIDHQKTRPTGSKTRRSKRLRKAS